MDKRRLIIMVVFLIIMGCIGWFIQTYGYNPIVGFENDSNGTYAFVYNPTITTCTYSISIFADNKSAKIGQQETYGIDVWSGSRRINGTAGTYEPPDFLIPLNQSSGIKAYNLSRKLKFSDNNNVFSYEFYATIEVPPFEKVKIYLYPSDVEHGWALTPEKLNMSDIKISL